jgi:predicted AAA+ superfamily ATPase
MNTLGGVFEEWSNYARKKLLKPRALDLEGVISGSKLKIISITGVRRSGKSSILMLILQKLAAENKNAAYINMEDSRIKDCKEVLDETIKWFGDSGYLLLDEITYADKWEWWLARNHELLKGKMHLIVSSSRKGLAIPIKPLRGRMFSYEIYPLSFSEFLQFKDIKLERTTAGIGKAERSFDEYLIFGGFPEVVLFDDKTDKTRLLNSYFKDIIGLDVAEISKENISAVELFGKYVIGTQYFSASKCLNFFKSLGYKIGKQSILNLERCSQEGYLFFFVTIFSYNIRDHSQYPRKSYAGDTGLMHAITGKTDMGRLFENAVFLELRRRASQQQEIHYWKSKDGYEVDFILQEGLKVKEIIQVVYDMSDKKTKEREVRGLVACAKQFGLKRGLIITKDFEGVEDAEGIRLHFITLWKWLLEH